jgi:hypothetical protein
MPVVTWTSQTVFRVPGKMLLCFVPTGEVFDNLNERMDQVILPCPSSLQARRKDKESRGSAEEPHTSSALD